MNVQRRTPPKRGRLSNIERRTPRGVSHRQPSFARIGILGGVFDPVHNGHLALAREARLVAGLDKIIFIPAAVSPLKADAPVASARDRVAMLRRAVAGLPEYEVSEIELDRGGISYTIETVQQLRGEYGPETEIFLIIGLDNLLQISRWRDIESLVKLCRFIIVTRPGCAVTSLSGDDKRWADRITGDGRGCIVSLSVPVSSTEIRDAVRAGADPAPPVPPGVADYIKEKGLYR